MISPLHILCIFIAFSWGCSSVEEPAGSPNLLFVFADQYRKQAAGLMKRILISFTRLQQCTPARMIPWKAWTFHWDSG